MHGLESDRYAINYETDKVHSMVQEITILCTIYKFIMLSVLFRLNNARKMHSVER